MVSVGDCGRGRGCPICRALLANGATHGIRCRGLPLDGRSITAIYASETATTRGIADVLTVSGVAGQGSKDGDARRCGRSLGNGPEGVSWLATAKRVRLTVN